MFSIVLAACLAQPATLDVLDGETLYRGGWLFTAAWEHSASEGARRGRERASDPLDRQETREEAAFAAHYGLRHDLQLSLLAGYAWTSLEQESPEEPDRLDAEGPLDPAFVAKWRFFRLDGPGFATNFAVLGGVEAPLGEGRAQDSGVRLAPELQPASASWDPALGVAVTHEPGRWRFNAAALFERTGASPRDVNTGDNLFLELAAGNRVWLLPYPGPFVRVDTMLRYRREGRTRRAGTAVENTGGDLVTAGVTVAFRPRPTLDFQLFLEIPVWQDLEGLQIENDWIVTGVIGWRM